MLSKTIPLAPSADPNRAFEITRETMEGRGYLWKPTGPASAVAHQGGKEVWSKVATMKLVLGVEVEGQNLKLEQQTFGLAGLGSGTPAVAILTNMEFRKIRKMIEKSLGDAGIAA